MKTKRVALVILAICFIVEAHGGSATWNLNPTSNDWDTALNWTPATVPNGPSDVATFARSNIKSIKFSGAMTEVAEMVFNPGASSFKIIADPTLAGSNVTLTISGPGITNNSGVTQNLIAGPTVFPGGVGIIEFLNAAAAGDGTLLSALGSATDGAFSGSVINFYDTSTAANASIMAEGARGRDDAGGGHVIFYNSATAANASFTATGSNALGGGGGEILFMDQSSAANANFTIAGGGNGGLGGEVWFSGNSTAEAAQFTLVGGEVDFFNTSTAGNAAFDIEGGQVTFSAFDENRPTAADGMFIINGGSVLFSGGTAGNATFIANSGGLTYQDDDESQALIQLFGNATLTLLFHSSGMGEVTVGSVEGDGFIVLSLNQKLLIGSNNLSTTFSGIIQDFGTGSLGKVGTGTLTLTGANTYRNGTTILSGILLVSNSSGSGTGTGAVSVNAGTLGGKGTIAGAVTVGTGSGAGAFLEASVGSIKPSSLTIQSALSFKSDSAYTYNLDTRRAKTDKVIANGVTIESGAQFNFVAAGRKELAPEKIFIALSNTAATPISGTFANLPDGGTITVGNNTFQARYEGGDGNDLTLTVLP